MDEGDFLEVVSMQGGQLVLKRARLVTYDTPEAEELERRADEDVAEGRFRTFTSSEALVEDLAQRWPEMTGEALRPSAVEAVTEALVEQAGGDTATALERARAITEELTRRVEEDEASLGA